MVRVLRVARMILDLRAHRVGQGTPLRRRRPARPFAAPAPRTRQRGDRLLSEDRHVHDVLRVVCSTDGEQCLCHVEYFNATRCFIDDFLLTEGVRVANSTIWNTRPVSKATVVFSHPALLKSVSNTPDSAQQSRLACITSAFFWLKFGLVYPK